MQLIPHLQAIVEVENASIHGYEATIRGHEHSKDLSAAILLRRAQRKHRLPDFDAEVYEAVLSAYSYSHPLFVNCTPQTLSQRQLRFPIGTDLSRIVLEITERSRFHVDLADIADYLRSFRKAGLRIAIDDFGTGWANFDRIAVLTPEYIKVDQSLTRNVVDHPGTQHLIAGLLSFATQLQTTLIAEGIETEAQARIMTSLGVPLVQGYYYDLPKPLFQHVKAAL